MKSHLAVLLLATLAPAIACPISTALGQIAQLYGQIPLPESSDSVSAAPLPTPDAGSNIGPAFGGDMGPRVFDNYGDFAIARSPTDYLGTAAYGPDWCNAWQGRVEWLLWFSRGRNTPPLVTSSPAGTPPAQAGVLGLDSTSVIYGEDPIGRNMRNGLRFTLGHVLADGITTATGRFWGVENGSETFAINSDNKSILARPFFNTLTSTQSAILVAYPGLTSAGSINVLSRNNLFGADAWVSRNLYYDGYHSFSVLAGYQFSRMDDSLVIDSLAIAGGTAINITDSFRTKNEFHGGTIGFLTEHRKHALSLEVLGKIALGNMHESVVINGQSTTTPPVGSATTSNGGLYALPTNIGSYQRNQFAVAPELNINGVVHFSPQWRAMIGYSIIYWSNAVLAGNQIDTHLDPAQTASSTSPAFSFQRADFLVQGISLGADYRW